MASKRMPVVMMERRIACAVCGDEECGPWGLHNGALLCEPCLDATRSLEAWSSIGMPPRSPLMLRRLVSAAGWERETLQRVIRKPDKL